MPYPVCEVRRMSENKRAETLLSIGEVCKLTGLTQRALRWYDEIGLVTPAGITEGGYRQYDARNLETLQQILFFRELGFPLAEVKRILTDPRFDREKALSEHRALLILQKERIEGLIHLSEQALKGETNMGFDKFDTTKIDEQKAKYAAEAKARWGNTEAYAESEKRQQKRSKADDALIQAEADEIFAAFAAHRGENPASEPLNALVDRWQAHITKHHYPCSDEILKSLAEMYVGDERFAATLDAFGEGTAQLMHDAILARR